MKTQDENLKCLKEAVQQYRDVFSNERAYYPELNATPLVKELLQLIKNQKELTYAEAYAALQSVETILKLESHFIQIR